jgi:hypothetical protein
MPLSFKPFDEMTPADYAEHRPESRPRGPPAAPDAAQAVLSLPRGSLQRRLRRRDPPAHAADAVRAGRVRRHGADGEEDPEEHLLPHPSRQRLHLRVRRHAAVLHRRRSPRHRPRDLHAAAAEHRRRAAHRAQAVPRRLDPDRLPAHRHHRRRRLDPVRDRRSASASSPSRRTPAARSPTSATSASTSPTASACRSSRRSPSPTCTRRRRPPKSARSSASSPQHRQGPHRLRRRPPGRQRQRHRRHARRDQGHAADLAQPAPHLQRGPPPVLLLQIRAMLKERGVTPETFVVARRMSRGSSRRRRTSRSRRRWGRGTW